MHCVYLRSVIILTINIINLALEKQILSCKTWTANCCFSCIGNCCFISPCGYWVIIVHLKQSHMVPKYYFNPIINNCFYYYLYLGRNRNNLSQMRIIWIISVNPQRSLTTQMWSGTALTYTRLTVKWTFVIWPANGCLTPAPITTQAWYMYLSSITGHTMSTPPPHLERAMRAMKSQMSNWIQFQQWVPALAVCSNCSFESSVTQRSRNTN